MLRLRRIGDAEARPGRQITQMHDQREERIALGKTWFDALVASPADKREIMHGDADRLLKLALSG